MTKHKKQRRTKRSQQGGGLLSWLGLETPVDQPQTYSQDSSQSWGDWFSGVGTKAKDQATNLITSADAAIGSAASSVTSAASNLNPLPVTQGQETYNTGTYNQGAIGGRRRRKSRKLHGGKGGLGLTYYATDVSNMKVAQPTYWIKGGSKRHKTRHRKRH